MLTLKKLSPLDGAERAHADVTPGLRGNSFSQSVTGHSGPRQLALAVQPGSAVSHRSLQTTHERTVNAPQLWCVSRCGGGVFL